MTAPMTGPGPKPITGSKVKYGVRDLLYTASEWRGIAMQARQLLDLNPNDEGARRTLESAQRVMRAHTQYVVAPMNQGANEREMANVADQAYAETASPYHAAILNTADAFSLGIGDEIAGLGAVLPGGMSPQQARDRYRAGLGQLTEDQPLASLGGQVFGAGLLGGAALQNFPGMAAKIAAGGTLMGSGAAAAATAAGVAGTEGVARGLLSEGSIADRLVNAAKTGGIYAATGAIGTGIVNRLRVGNRFWGATRAAQKRILGNQALASDLDVAAKQAGVGMNQARERSLTIGADVAEQTAPNRIAVAQAQADALPGKAALQDARVEAIPTHAEMLDDRAIILKFHADRVRGMMAAGNVAPASGTRSSPDELRAWARQNMAPDLVDGFVERAGRTPGSGIAPPAIEPPAPRVEAPSAGHAQDIVGEAQMPGQALHDVAGTPIPGTIIDPAGVPLPFLELPASPPAYRDVRPGSDAAREAFRAEIEGPGPSMEVAKKMAARAAVTARGLPTAPATGQSLFGEFTAENQRRAYGHIASLSPERRVNLLRQVEAPGALPTVWRDFLTNALTVGR